MCLDFVNAQVFKLFVFYGYVILTKAMVMSPQLYSSPCPDTFQYQTDQNGELYGTIGVYSFDDNVVQLNVELSVGNQVNNYNGKIELAYPKNQVINDIRHRRPIKYKIFFPRWESIPPKVTKIMVNGQMVCSGPKIKMGGWVSVLTTINLQHTLMVKVTPLQAENPFVPNDQTINNPFTPKENGRGTDIVGFKPETPENPFVRNPFISTSSTTSEKPNSNSIPTSDFIFSKNPFLNGNRPVLQTVPNVTYPDLSPRNTSPRPRTTSPTPRIPSATPRNASPKPRPPSDDDNCGISVVPNPLVVNGNSVPRGAFPWLVAMFSETSTGLEYKCSGTLISKKHVVTAAHCVEQGRKRIRADKLLFVLGKQNIKRWTQLDGEKMVEADDIMVHPDYVPLSSDADIAVATLSEEIQFSKYIRPICLWSESDEIDKVIGEKGKVVGWGKDENGAIMTAEPKQVTMPIVSQEQCLWSSEAFKFITSPRTFCAGDRNGTGPCNGDSGSGFVMKRNGRWVLRGVVSISTYDSNKQTCDLQNYIVFTDASKFRTWLLSFL